jgi:hypothetical protein
METIRLNAGATVLTGTTHGGIGRLGEGFGVLRRVLVGALRTLDTWHDASVAAHNDAALEAMAGTDHRVLQELRAIRARSEA